MKTAQMTILALILGASCARADFITIATLTGAQEVPPNASAATGFATIVYEEASQSLAYSVAFSGLTTPATAAHIHVGAPGVAGPIIFPFAVVPSVTSGSFAGILTAADFTPGGGLTTFAQAVAAIQAGGTYVNIHNATFPAGEIRGQLLDAAPVVPEPAGVVLLGLGGGALVGCALRRRSTATA